MKKSLKRLGEDPDDEEMACMYKALRRTKQRVSADEWEKCKKRKEYRSALKRVVFGVPRQAEARAYLETHPKLHLELSDLDQVPPNVDPNSVFFVDSGCNREALGPGVLEW